MPVPSFTHKIISKIIRQIAPYVPLPVYRSLLPRNPIGFFYHTVSDESLPHVKHLYPYKSAAEFEQDILYLKQQYTLIGYPELLPLIGSPAPPLTAPSAFLSFDDGFSECYTVVCPILLKHRVPCLFFLATDWIDNQAMYYRGKISLSIEAMAALDEANQISALQQINQTFSLTLTSFPAFSAWIRGHQKSNETVIDQVCDLLGVDISDFLRVRQPFLTRAQIAEMQAEGFVFGAHTCSHPKLSTVSQEEQAAEIVESCRILCEITGKDQVPFAFPFSGSGVDCDFLASLRAQHPHIGPIFDTQKLRQDLPFMFHRIWADKPVPGVPPSNNLAYWLHDAYKREITSSQRNSPDLHPISASAR